MTHYEQHENVNKPEENTGKMMCIKAQRRPETLAFATDMLLTCKQRNRKI